MQQIKFFRAYYSDPKEAKQSPNPAKDKEIVIPGTFIYSKLDPDKKGDTEKLQSLWLGAESGGFCRLAVVDVITANEYQRLINQIAHYMVEHKFASDLGAAFEQAQEEVDHTKKLADRELGSTMLIDRKMEKFGVSETYKTMPR